MAQLLQCRELIAEFQLRIGEPEEGTFGIVYYDSLRENVDELRSILNQAQRHVAWKCYSANQTILEKTEYIQILSGVTRYTLGEDFLGPVSLFYRTAGQETPIEKDNLDDIRSGQSSEPTSYRFENYEIREQVPAVAAVGVIAEDSLNEITDTIITHDAPGNRNALIEKLKAVRVGDTVHNLTDGSFGVISALFNSTGRAETSRLAQGDANRFQKGDIYQIEMQESTRDAIDFYPQVIKDDVTTAHNGLPSNWQINEDSVLTSIDADITQIPVGFESDERLIMYVLSNGEEVTRGAREGLSQGTNEFVFPNPTQLREDTLYTVTVERANGNAIDIDMIEVFVAIDPDVVVFKQAKLPRIMDSRDSFCEMPSWSLESIYSYAHVLANQKATRNPTPDAGLVKVFNDSIDDIGSFLFKRDERGPHQLPTLSGRSSGWPYPSNYGYSVIDPFDL